MKSYPSYRELATRYGVGYAVIGDYAKKHNCQQRRKLAEVRILARADEKQIEIQAEAIAFSREEEIAIIDTYLLGFKKALAEGRVRFDNPTDFNTLSRLKEFLQGGADSRQEVHGLPSLDELQARHLETLRVMREATPAERGEVPLPTRIRVALSPDEGSSADALASAEAEAEAEDADERSR